MRQMKSLVGVVGVGIDYEGEDCLTGHKEIDCTIILGTTASWGEQGEFRDVYTRLRTTV
jgi:hypothetical protein